MNEALQNVIVFVLCEPDSLVNDQAAQEQVKSLLDPRLNCFANVAGDGGKKQFNTLTPLTPLYPLLALNCGNLKTTLVYDLTVLYREVEGKSHQAIGGTQL